MIFSKEVFNKINTVNKNLVKLSRYNHEDGGDILLKTLTNDLAFIVAKINETYETLNTIISENVKEKD